MLKNWSKIALASCLVLMIGSSLAFATTARVRSLANTGDYISDDSAVNRWYSTLPSFGNQVNAEMGTWTTGDLTDTRGLGWTHACGEDGKWGTYRISLNENSVDHDGFWIGNPFYQNHTPGNATDLDPPAGVDPTWDDTPMNKWDIAGGWELGEAIALGLSFTRSSWSAESAILDLEASNSFTTIGGGITWTNNDNMVFDASITYGTAGGDARLGTTSAEWDSKNAFDIAARLFYDWKENVTLVPVIEYATSEYSLQQTGPPATAIPTPNGSKNSDMLIGLGLNMDVNQNNMLVFALEFMNRKFEYSNAADAAAVGALEEYTQKYLPTIRLALETEITSWLSTRVGAAKYIVTDKAKFVGGDKEEQNAGTPSFDPNQAPAPLGFEWFLGCGFNVAEWTVDLELASETPFKLGYWLTGYNGFDGTTGPIGRISAVWNY